MFLVSSSLLPPVTWASVCWAALCLICLWTSWRTCCPERWWRTTENTWCLLRSVDTSRSSELYHDLESTLGTPGLYKTQVHMWPDAWKKYICHLNTSLNNESKWKLAIKNVLILLIHFFFKKCLLSYLNWSSCIIIFISQKPDRFKLAPEMDVYVSDFLQGCEDSDKQLVVMVAFSSLTNQGYPVVPSVWRVVQHLQPAALQAYVDWLKQMFMQPQFDKLLDFSTRKQKDNKDAREQWVLDRCKMFICTCQVWWWRLRHKTRK